MVARYERGSDVLNSYPLPGLSATEQAGQVAESLTAASANVQNLVSSAQVPRDDLGVNPRHLELQLASCRSQKDRSAVAVTGQSAH
jgi:hypothetical protein